MKLLAVYGVLEVSSCTATVPALVSKVAVYVFVGSMQSCGASLKSIVRGEEPSAAGHEPVPKEKSGSDELSGFDELSVELASLDDTTSDELSESVDDAPSEPPSRVSAMAATASSRTAATDSANHSARRLPRVAALTSLGDGA